MSGNSLGLVTLICAAFYYRQALESRRVSTWAAAAGLVGFVVLAACLSSIYDEWSDRWFSAHMGQHMLLILIVAPLMVIGRVSAMVMRGLPLSIRRGWSRFSVTRWAKPLTATAALPAITWWWAHVGVVWAWHAPPLYDLALDNPWLHASEHILFLGTAVAFWDVILRAGRRHGVSVGLAIGFLVAAGLQGAVLGAILLFANKPLYPAYVLQTSGGFSPLDDQQLAGLIMWLPASVVYLVAIGFIFINWFQSEGRSADRGEARLSHVDSPTRPRSETESTTKSETESTTRSERVPA